MSSINAKNHNPANRTQQVTIVQAGTNFIKSKPKLTKPCNYNSVLVKSTQITRIQKLQLNLKLKPNSKTNPNSEIQKQEHEIKLEIETEIKPRTEIKILI